MTGVGLGAVVRSGDRMVLTLGCGVSDAIPYNADSATVHAAIMQAAKRNQEFLDRQLPPPKLGLRARFRAWRNREVVSP